MEVVPHLTGQGVIGRRTQRRPVFPKTTQSVHATAPDQPLELQVVVHDTIVDDEIWGPGQRTRLETEMTDERAQLRVAGDVVELGDPSFVADARLGQLGGPHPSPDPIALLQDDDLGPLTEHAFEQIRAQQSTESAADDTDPFRQSSALPNAPRTGARDQDTSRRSPPALS